MRALIILLVLSITFFYCNKSNSSNEPALGLGGVTAISGKIENFTLGNNYIIKFMHENGGTSFGQANVDVNGNFNIAGITACPDNMLEPIDSTLNKNLVIDNHNARVSSGFLSLYQSGQTEPFTNIMEGKITDKQVPVLNDFVTSYPYSNANVNITGSFTETQGLGTFKYIYNLNITKGWNKIFSKVTKAENNSYEITVINTQPEASKFYLGN